MILPTLIRHHLKHKDDEEFYRLQAVDAIEWIQKQGVSLGSGVRALDLGCGHGIFGGQLRKLGCDVAFSDDRNWLSPQLKDAEFIPFNLDREPLSKLGQFDLVICSNVLEHLSQPEPFLQNLHLLLNPGGSFYLSWTNWLSPWGGHEFSPYHYLGPKLGTRVFDKLKGTPRFHTPYQNLFPTSIGRTLQVLRANPQINITSIAPRYYPEFKILAHLPIVREFAMWNCAILLRKRG